MPDDSPPTDGPDRVRWLLDAARDTASCRVHPVGAVTEDRAGRRLAPLTAMARAGTRVFSDDGHCVDDPVLLRAAPSVAAATGTVITQREVRATGREFTGRCGRLSAGPAARSAGDHRPPGRDAGSRDRRAAARVPRLDGAHRPDAVAADCPGGLAETLPVTADALGHAGPDWPLIAARLAYGPARVAGLADRAGRPPAEGEPATFTLVDPWQVTGAGDGAAGGVQLDGRVVATVVDGFVTPRPARSSHRLTAGRPPTVSPRRTTEFPPHGNNTATSSVG